MRLDHWDEQATLTVWFDSFAEFREWTEKFPKDLLLINESQSRTDYLTFGYIVKIAYPLFLKCIVPLKKSKKEEPTPAIVATEIPMEKLGIQEVVPTPMGSPS